MARQKTHLVPLQVLHDRAMVERGNLAEAFTAEKGVEATDHETGDRGGSETIDWSKVTPAGRLPLAPQTAEHKAAAPAPEQRDYASREEYETACSNWRARFFGVKGDEYRAVEHKSRQPVPFIPARAGAALPDDAERTRQDRLTFAAAESAERERALTDAYLQQLQYKAQMGIASPSDLRVLQANDLIERPTPAYTVTTAQMLESLMND